MISGLVLATALGVIGAGHAARADESVLALHIEAPKLAAKERDDLYAALRAKLGLYPAIKLAAAPEGDLTDLMLELECVDIDASCLGKIGDKLGADKVIFIDGDAKALRMRVVGVEKATKSGKMLREKELKGELAAAVGAEVEAVWGKLPEKVIKIEPPKITTGSLTIKADPADAAIFVGEAAVGAGQVTIEREAGDYTVRVVAKGFEDQIFKVTVPAGGKVQKDVALKAVAVVPPDVKKKDKDKASGGTSWVVWTLIGAVVVGGAVAIIAVATQDNGGASPRGPALIGLDPSGAWRDAATLGGRP